MRKSLWIILTVLLVAIGAPNAHADRIIGYTAVFTCNTGECRPSLPPITGDTPVGVTVVVDDPTTVDLTWFGYSFTIGLPRGAGVRSSFNWVGSVDCEAYPCTLGMTGPNGKTTVDIAYNPFFSEPRGTYDGGLTFTPIYSSPEPSALALMLIGLGMLGLMMVMRKRISWSLPRAS